jgi:hypothetical protein
MLHFEDVIFMCIFFGVDEERASQRGMFSRVDLGKKNLMN